MLLHVRLLMESLSAVAARIRPRVGVNQEMSRQSAASLERLAALLALQEKREIILSFRLNDKNFFPRAISFNCCLFNGNDRDTRRSEGELLISIK